MGAVVCVTRVALGDKVWFAGAGVELGDIDLALAWQSWHLPTQSVFLTLFAWQEWRPVTSTWLRDIICDLALGCIQSVMSPEFASPGCVLRCRHGHVYFSVDLLQT